MVTKFKELSLLWIKEKQKVIKHSTYCAYFLVIENQLNNYFDLIDDVTEEKVMNFCLEKFKSGLSKKSVKDIFVVLKMILKFGAKISNVRLEVISMEFPFKEGKQDIQVFSKQHQKKLTEYLLGNFSFSNLGILIALNTGLRIGEICALQWKDIDIDNRLLRVTKTLQRVYNKEKRETEIIITSPKTEESKRSIPLSNQLFKLIKPLIRILNEDYYIISNDVNSIEPRTYREMYRKVLGKCNIPYLKFHALRHTFATRCVESKGDYKTISSILGHTSITTTLNLYVHPNNDQKKSCIEKMLKFVDINK